MVEYLVKITKDNIDYFSNQYKRADEKLFCTSGYPVNSESGLTRTVYKYGEPKKKGRGFLRYERNKWFHSEVVWERDILMPYDFVTGG